MKEPYIKIGRKDNPQKPIIRAVTEGKSIKIEFSPFEQWVEYFKYKFSKKEKEVEATTSLGGTVSYETPPFSHYETEEFPVKRPLTKISNHDLRNAKKIAYFKK